MDNFLKNKLNDYDAGYDNSAWDNIEDRVQENNLGNDSLKNNLKGFDAGYNQNAWNNIAGKVSQNNLAFRSKLLTRKIASAAVFVGVILSSFIGYSVFNELNEQLVKSKKVPTNETLESAILIPTIKTAEKTIKNENDNISSIKEDLKDSENDDLNLKVQMPRKQKSKTISTLASPTIKKPSPELPKLYIEKNEYCLGESLNARIHNESDKNIKIRIAEKWLTKDKLSNYQLNKSGEVELELYEVNSKNNLIKIENIKIIVHDRANAKFFHKKDKQNDVPVTRFELADKNLSSVNWYVGRRLIASSQTVNYTFVNKGKYPVKLVTNNANGCKDSSTQTIRILKAYNLLATQIFNPKTETWLPMGLKKTNDSFEIKIISSDGKQAFETKNSETEWNGIIEESGKKANNGDEFYWLARLTNNKGDVREYGGSFIISSVVH